MPARASSPVVYSIQPCRLGRLLAASTLQGICFLALGDSDDFLLKALDAVYPGCQPAAPGSPGDDLARRAAACLETPRESNTDMLEIPLDLAGTEFQKRAWQAMREIPAGSFLTYSQLAERLGVPGGARAVGHACAQNPVSVLIPCHRLLRRDGGLGGYAWGLERKRALLRAEGAPGFADL